MRGCSGSHLLIVVGCVAERGEVTSEVGGITFGINEADTGESVQGGLIHWATLRRWWQNREVAGNEVDSPHRYR